MYVTAVLFLATEPAPSESSPSLNGINTSNMSSSRSRERRRSSSRKSFSEEEDSPVHARKSVSNHISDSKMNGVADTSTHSNSPARDRTKTTIPIEKTNGRISSTTGKEDGKTDTVGNNSLSTTSPGGLRKSKTTSSVLPPKSPQHLPSGRLNGKKGNRGSEIILDVNSILDQLMGEEELDELDEEVPMKKETKPTHTLAPSRQKEKESVSSPSVKTKSSRDDEPTTVKTTPTPTPKSSPSHAKFGEELPIYNLRSRRSVNRLEGGTKNESEESKPPRPVTTDTTPTTKPAPVKKEIIDKSPPPKSEYKISTEEKEGLNMTGKRGRSRESFFSNGLDDEDKDDINTLPSRMRTRSTAIGSQSSRDRLRVRAFQDFNLDPEEEKQLVMKGRRKPRPSSTATGDAAIGRSGSFKRRQQMDGDKALGLFYHNRHSQSQFNDLEHLEESHLSRASSVDSDPHSPTLRSRESPFSPRESSFSPIPQSPLVSKQVPSFEVDQKKVEPVEEDKESEPEVGILL